MTSKSEFDRLELINYKYGLYLLNLLRMKFKTGSDTELLFSQNLPVPEDNSRNEFASDLKISDSKIFLRRRTLSAPTGQLAVLSRIKIIYKASFLFYFKT